MASQSWKMCMELWDLPEVCLFLCFLSFCFVLLFSEPTHWNNCNILSNTLWLNLTFYILIVTSILTRGKDLWKYEFSDGKYIGSPRLKEECMFTICSFDGKWCFLIRFSSYHCIANDIMILNHIIGTVMIGCEEIIERRSPVASKCHSLLQLETAIGNLQPLCWLKMFNK